MLSQGFGAALKEARHRTGLSQERFAAELSTDDDAVTGSAVSSWERNEHEPEVRRWGRIASLLEEGSPDNIGIAEKLFGDCLSYVHHKSVTSTIKEGDAMSDAQSEVLFRALSRTIVEQERRIAALEAENIDLRAQLKHRPTRTRRT